MSVTEPDRSVPSLDLLSPGRGCVNHCPSPAAPAESAGSNTTTAVSAGRIAAYASRFLSISAQRAQSRSRSAPCARPAHWLMCADVSAGCWWCRWHRHVTAIHSAAARSAVTWPPRDLLLSTGGTDEQQHADDTGVLLLIGPSG